MREIDSLIKSCTIRNETFERSMAYPGTLGEFLEEQKEKTCHNRSLKRLRDPDDYLACCRDYIAERLDEDAAAEAVETLRLGCMNTADHHGGIYSAQSLQGDMLFGRMLKLLGSRDRYVPIFSFSQVELENSTYARGFLNYGSNRRSLRFPLQPQKDLNRMVACCDGYDAEMLKRIEKTIARSADITEAQKAVMLSVAEEVYSRPEYVSLPRYADQCFYIGKALSERYFPDDAYPSHLYIEAEEAMLPLFERELKDETSLLRHMFYDEKLRKSMNRICTDEGIPLAGMLLRGADEIGRRVNVQVREDGVIEGMDRRGQLVSYPSEPEELIALLRERKLLISAYSIALMTAFERGICWYGGVFQSIYLPKWQKLTVKALRESGFGEEAELISAYECDGYISGPVFVLARTAQGGAACAGPFEFITHPQKTDAFEKWMKLSLSETHILGMFEIYFDLVPAAERGTDWYEKLCTYCAKNYSGEVMK